MGCDLLDLRCIFVNELVGSALLAMVLVAIIYFIVAAKMKWGFDTTIALIFPIMIILSLAISSFAVIFAFATIMAGILIAWIFQKIIGN